MEEGAVYQCGSCALIFIDPMMSDEEERLFYQNFNQHVKDRGVTLQNSIEEYHQKLLPVARERWGVVREYFAGKKVLEIGSSTGAFLAQLDDAHTYACELTDENRVFSKQFITGEAYASIDEVNEYDFDVICMFHVFEHIKQPIAFLKQCQKRLAQGGQIVIEVPCAEDPLISIYDLEAFKDFLFQPMHPMVYSEPSLDHVFGQAGFTKERVIYHQRYGLDNHLAWLRHHKPGGDQRFSELFGSNSLYKQQLEAMKKTDTIFYIVRQG
jgi:SAM-dependent methyltransferase